MDNTLFALIPTIATGSQNIVEPKQRSDLYDIKLAKRHISHYRHE